MSLYTIGDTHLSLGTAKPMDVFRGWEGYLQKLEENWRALVRPGDTVVIPGDISWAMTLPEAEADFRFLESLPGEKILLKGNHDYWFTTRTGVERFLEEKGVRSIRILFNNAFAREGWAICGTRGWVNESTVPAADQKVIDREAGRLRLSLEAGRQLGLPLLAFLHYPPVYYVNECREILEVLHEYGVKRCYYGHIHGTGHRYAVDGLFEEIDFRLVAGDYVRFCPVKVDGNCGG